VSDGGWVVVGLGNPGPEYEGTRHNVGFLVVDELARRDGQRFRAHKRARALVSEARVAGQRAVLVKPRTYMNESGQAVAPVCDFYRVDADHTVVVHDELDLPFGSLRLKLGGGDNGHNGLRSVRQALGTGDFSRARFGIGRPPGRMDASAYVLRGWSKAERQDLDVLVGRTADAVEALVSEGLERAQSAFND
jgi:PTH1 family peptidyl-tRNA hydrolase